MVHPAAPCRLLPTFDELAPSLDSGDVLLFAGQSRFCCTLKRLMNSRWSHAALVARPRADGPLLLWEATMSSGIPDVVTREMRPGVNLYDLRTWITTYAAGAGGAGVRAGAVRQEKERTAEPQRPQRKRREEVGRRVFCLLSVFLCGLCGSAVRSLPQR